MARSNRRQEVYGEGGDKDAEEKGNDPFEDGGQIVATFLHGYAKYNCQSQEEEDPAQLQPEGEAQQPILSLVDPQPLVLGADEDGGDNVTDDEDGEHHIMEMVVPARVKDRQQDQSRTADDAEYTGQDIKDLLALIGMGSQPLALAQPV